MTSAPAMVHVPAGAGHPYATSPDQRVPVRPEAGRPVRLGVRVREDVTAVVCEWQDEAVRDEAVQDGTAAGGDRLRVALEPAAPSAADAAALAGGEGHLAEAQAQATRDTLSWACTVPGQAAGSRARYRFVATTPAGEEATGWFPVSAASWQRGAGTLTVDGRPDHDLLDADSVEWLVDGEGVHRVRFALHLAPGDHVVGFGERFDALDQRGRTLDAVVFEQYKAQGRHGRTYLPMPFAHVVPADGSPGWGFHVRTSRRTWYDVGATDGSALRIEAALGGTHDEQLDVGIYTGGPAAVLDAFLGEVGRPEVLPAWVHRLWASGNEWNTQEIVQARMDAHEFLDIPVGVVVIEAWSDEEGITIFRDARYEVTRDGAPHTAADFSYPPDGAWPDPAAMIAGLHDRGVKVVLWQIPLLKTRFDLPDVPADAQVLLDGEALVAGGHAVLEADGSAYNNRGWWFPQALMPDLSTQRTRDWWTEKRRYLVRELDVDGFKTDGGEHAWGDDLRYGDGRRGSDGNNLYPVHYARAFGDLLRSEGKAPVTFSRAGFTGSQAHGVFWAGDEDSTWEAFRSSVLAGLTASACGIVYWGWDLAGFSGPVPDGDLYLRAATASAFMPVMQYHSEFNHHRRPLRDRTPWYVAEVNGDPEVLTVFRRYAQLRERLVPYLAEQAGIAVERGLPLMRPLFFDHGHDARVWDHPLQFLLGDALLVAPVTEPGVRQWSTYLPPGDWVDVWTGEPTAGGRPVTRDVPRSIVPVYCRADRWADLAVVFDEG